MRRAVLASIGFLAAAGIASAETLDGRWSLIAEECGAEISDGILTIDTAAGTLTYWESLCTVIELIPIGTMELVWQASMSCSGEGETRQRDALLAIDIPLDGVGTPRLVEIDMADGFVISRTFCGAAGK
ncbi:MAG: hypothetical protein AB7O56_07965 [Bauldia sp.]